MSGKPSATSEGVERAMDFWLSQHPVTMEDVIMVAVEQAVSKWLNANSDEVVAAIAKQAVYMVQP